MENLVNILDSFQSGWRERKCVARFITILNELIIPSYSFLDARIENNKARKNMWGQTCLLTLEIANYFNRGPVTKV
jgi:hypothetical protein